MIDNQQLKGLNEQVNQIARQAGGILLKYFGTGYDISMKDDQSPVTTADLAANEYIEQHLHELTPDIPRISEESTNCHYQARKHWRRCWLIDPLDGTREFIKKRPDFTVNIALVENNRPILGVIYLPVADHLYFASKNNGACRCIKGSQATTIHVTSKKSCTPRICGSHAYHGRSMRRFLNNVGAHQLIARGSSIKSCLIADGSADIYPRFGPTWEWDTAAAQCIIEQAGGCLTNLELRALDYNKESLLNPSFLAFGNKNVDWKRYLV